jgi:hypothetical protein
VLSMLVVVVVVVMLVSLPPRCDFCWTCALSEGWLGEWRMANGE